MQTRPKLCRALELEALIAKVTSSGVGILAHKNTGSDISAGILGEVPADWQGCGVSLRPDPHNLLHRPGLNDPGRQEVGEGLYPGIVKPARLGPNHARDPLAAGGQVWE